MMSRQPLGSTSRNTRPEPSVSGGQPVDSTETVYRGRRDPTAPVGEEYVERAIDVTEENFEQILEGDDE